MNTEAATKQIIKQELETMVKDRVIWGFSLAFVEKEKADLSYHGVYARILF